MDNVKKGDLVKCICIGCQTKLTVLTNGVHPGKCRECSSGQPHTHNSRGVYVPQAAKMPWEKKGEGQFVHPD
jgi:hypothetical protein